MTAREAERLGWLDASGAVHISSWIVHALCAVCAVALAACWLVHTDVVVQAAVTLVPRDEALPVQAQRAGWVKMTLVEPGAVVRAGDPLLELDHAEADAASNALVERQNILDARIAAQHRLEELQRGLVESERQEALAALTAARALSKEAVVELRRFRSEATLSSEVARRRASLAERGMVSKEDAERAFLEESGLRLQQERASHRRRGQRAEEDRVRRSLRTRELVASVDGVATEVELALLRDQRTQIAEQLAQMRLLAERSIIRAPRSGTVLDLRIRGANVRVDAGETLAWVAPAGDDLVAELVVPPRGAGLIHPGMIINVKLDAYPYQDFGLLRGQLSWIAADVSRNPSSEERGALRKARAALETVPHDERGRPLPLHAGMLGTAEVVLFRASVGAALFRTFRGATTSVSR